MEHNDDLSLALQQMQENLQRISQKHLQQLWLQSAKKEFEQKIKGDSTLPKLLHDIFEFYKSHALASVGAVHLVKNNVCTLQYVFGSDVNSVQNVISEPIINEIATTNASRIFTRQETLLFDKYANESDELDTLLAVPAIFANKTVAVLELVKNGQHTANEMQLLQTLSELAAVNINTVVAKQELENLIHQLRSQEHELNNRILAINKSNASIEFDLHGNIISVNQIFLDLLGYDEADVIGRHHSMFLVPGQAETAEYLHFWDNLRKGTFHQDEFMRIRKDGQSVWLRGNYNPILDEEGNPIKILKIATDITVAKKQQIEIDAITTAIYKSNLTIEFNLDGHILNANDSFLSLVGYSFDEVVGKHHSILVAPEHRESIEYKTFWKNLKQGLFQAGEYKRVTKSGETVWIKGNYNPIFDTKGNPYKVIKIASDVTNAKKQQIEIDAITVAIYKSSLAIELDMDGMILNANPIFEDIMGYSVDEIIGKHHSILLDTEQRDSTDYRQFWANLQQGEYQEGEFRRITKGGDTVWIKGNYNPIFDTEGKPYKILKIATDVTLARTQSEELAIQAEELTKQQQELTNMNLELEQHAESLRQQHEKLQLTNEQLEEQAKALEIRNQEVQAAKQLVEQRTAQLEISSKYKSEFLANMSHELRTPLNSLLILSQDLAANKYKNLTHDQIESAEVIYKSGNDLLTLINEVLDLSKIEAGKMTLNVSKVKISTLVKDLYLGFRHHAEKKSLKYNIIVDDSVPEFIVTDVQRLEQVLKNIIINAIKFTDKGEVNVSIEKHASNTISIAVTDTGIGIPASQQASVFEAFQQVDGGTSRKYGGTGLGLSISRDLVKLLEGEIHLESTLGKGSTFTVMIPISVVNKSTASNVKVSIDDHDLPANNVAFLNSFKPYAKTSAGEIFTPETSAADVQLSGKRILVVDDDMRNVFALSKVLRDRGMEVLKAENGRVAIQILTENPAVDMILMDIMMPEMDGLSAMREIRSLHYFQELPIVALTAKAMTEDRQLCIKAGASEYITKPIDVENLLTIMRSFIGSESLKDIVNE
jgi:PAS domain S-box-containing protein